MFVFLDHLCALPLSPCSLDAQCLSLTLFLFFSIFPFPFCCFHSFTRSCYSERRFLHLIERDEIHSALQYSILLSLPFRQTPRCEKLGKAPESMLQVRGGEENNYALTIISINGIIGMKL